MDLLDALSAPRPQLSMATAEEILAREFGLAGELHALSGERDQNFRLTATDGREFVFKIAGSVEPQAVTDFQIGALLHIEQRGCPVAVPRIQRTLSGETVAVVEDAAAVYRCRVQSYVPGKPISGIALNAELLVDFGRAAATLDRALAGFSHPGDSPELLWDVQRTRDLRRLLQYVDDDTIRTAVAACLDDFDRNVEPVLPVLRQQVIHNDLNADNVLACPDNPDSVAGFIDFGDMLRAPLIAEVAIAAAYLRSTETDGLEFIVPFVRGFSAVIDLQGPEIAVLFDLIRARLAATISITNWRLASRGADDAYAYDSAVSESDAAQFLARLTAGGRRNFVRAIS